MHEVRKPNTKERLFEAAIEVFAERGYQGATVRAICERAGANVASVNYHYGDKENLYAQVLNHIFSNPRATHGAQRPDMTNAPAEDRLREYIRNFFYDVYSCVVDKEKCTKLGAIYLMEMAHPSPILDDIVEEYIRPDSDYLRSIIRDYLGEGFPFELREYCAAAIASQVLHYCSSWPIIERLNPDQPHIHTMLNEISELAFQFTLGGIERFKNLPSSTHAPLK